MRAETLTERPSSRESCLGQTARTPVGRRDETPDLAPRPGDIAEGRAGRAKEKLSLRRPCHSRKRKRPGEKLRLRRSARGRSTTVR